MQPIGLCTVKILEGGAGVVVPSVPPPPYEQLFVTLNPRHPTSSIFHCYPTTIHYPSPRPPPPPPQ